MYGLNNNDSEDSLFYAKHGRVMTADEWDKFEADGNWDFMDGTKNASKGGV